MTVGGSSGSPVDFVHFWSEIFCPLPPDEHNQYIIMPNKPNSLFLMCDSMHCIGVSSLVCIGILYDLHMGG